jgi:uncharacterized protein
MFPLSSTMDIGPAATAIIAIVLGIGFGFFLERAGFGSARKLVAVFYFYDMSVVKVMFTAIVTAMTGLFLLSAIGVLDLAEVYIEPTNYTAQIVGGLIFGAGFVIGGYCPGTAVAATATGRLDGLTFAAGMLGGVYAWAEFFPGIDQLIADTSRGEVTLPGLTGIPMGWFVLLFIGFLALAGWGMSIAEKKFAGLRP